MPSALGALVIALLLAQDKLDKLAAQRAYADEIPAYSQNHNIAIEFWANYYHADVDEIKATIHCESGGDPAAVGDFGTSIGIAQIHLPAHLDVTREQAEDADFSIQWMAKQWNVNKKIWSCARILGYTE